MGKVVRVGELSPAAAHQRLELFRLQVCGDSAPPGPSWGEWRQFLARLRPCHWALGSTARYASHAFLPMGTCWMCPATPPSWVVGCGWMWAVTGFQSTDHCVKSHFPEMVVTNFAQPTA